MDKINSPELRREFVFEDSTSVIIEIPTDVNEPIVVTRNVDGASEVLYSQTTADELVLRDALYFALQARLRKRNAQIPKVKDVIESLLPTDSGVCFKF